MQFHHIQELITEKKLEVRKIDTKVNITNCLTKLLLEQHFGALRTRMGLRQAIELKGVDQGVEGKSKTDPIGRADKAKSKESER